jgi:hypothetical protein
MNRIITKKAALVFFASVATDATVRAQKPEAVNGILLTVPWQTVSEDIIRNHIFSDDTYSWQFVVATLPNPSTQLTLTGNGYSGTFTSVTGCTGEIFMNDVSQRVG